LSNAKKDAKSVRQAARADGNLEVRLRVLKSRLKARSITIKVAVERRGVTGHTEKGDGSEFSDWLASTEGVSSKDGEKDGERGSEVE